MIFYFIFRKEKQQEATTSERRVASNRPPCQPSRPEPPQPSQFGTPKARGSGCRGATTGRMRWGRQRPATTAERAQDDRSMKRAETRSRLGPRPTTLRSSIRSLDLLDHPFRSVNREQSTYRFMVDPTTPQNQQSPGGMLQATAKSGGVDGTRTRGLRRDRPAF